MSFKSNTDLKNIRFLNTGNNLKEINEKYLKSLKRISDVKIDEETYDKMIDDLKNKKFRFKINIKEQNHINNISEN